MFGLSQKEKNIKIQSEFEKNVMHYIRGESDKLANLFIESYNDSMHKNLVDNIYDALQPILEKIPKHELQGIVDKIVLLVPYNEEKVQEIIGASFTLIGLRMMELGEEKIATFSNEEEVVVTLWKELIGELNLLHQKHFQK